MLTFQEQAEEQKAAKRGPDGPETTKRGRAGKPPNAGGTSSRRQAGAVQAFATESIAAKPLKPCDGGHQVIFLWPDFRF